MTILWRMVLAHFLADFTLQFDAVNRLKRKSIWGMVLHCFTHLFTSILLTWDYLGLQWIDLRVVQLNGWWAMLILLLSHFVIDQGRVYSFRNLGFKDGTLSFVIDQFLHMYVLLMITPVSSGGADFFRPERWVGVFTMFVMVSHVTTVLIYYIEKDLHEKQFPNFDEKYFLIFERIVLWAFFFVSGWWWMPFAAAWIFQIFYIRRKRIIDLSMANICISVALAAFFGLWTRYIYFGTLA